METVQELEPRPSFEPHSPVDGAVQPSAFFLELSLDWIVLRASENVHHLLGESHVTLIDEPFGRFVHSQPLHDLRNLFSRLSGTTGIGRAYAVRLTNDPDLVDIAFHLSDGRVLLEATRSSGSYGEAFGTVGGLITGLSNMHGHALVEGAARRMRALAGYDRVTLVCAGDRAESSRGAFAASSDMAADVPAIIADTGAPPVALFPRKLEDSSAADALMRSPDRSMVDALEAAGVRALLRVPFSVDGLNGEFRCESRSPRAPSFELHAAAELFAQMFAMRLAMDEAA